MYYRNPIKTLINALKVHTATEGSSSCLGERKDRPATGCHVKKKLVLFDLFTRSKVKRQVEIFRSKRYESPQGQEDTHGATDTLTDRSPDGFELNTSSFLAPSACLSTAQHRGASEPTAHPSLAFLHFITDRKCTYNLSS